MKLKIARNRKLWRIASLAAWKQEDCAQARMQLEAALEKSESFGQKDLRLAVTLANLAQIYHSGNREKEAKCLFQQAQSTLDGIPTPPAFYWVHVARA